MLRAALLLSILALLIAAPSALADPLEIDLTDGETQKAATKGCRLASWTGGDPEVRVDPLLGLLKLDPNGCLTGAKDFTSEALNG